MSLEDLNNQAGQDGNQPNELSNQNNGDSNQSLLNSNQDQQESNQPGQEGLPVVPESIDGYEVNIDGFDFDEFKSFDENKEFLERARTAGMDNKALGFLLDEYNQLIPNLVQANAALDNEACINHMEQQWGGDTQKNFGFAKAAADNAIQNGILTAEEVNSPEFGNNPLVLKMAAYFGQQLREDTPLSNTQQTATTSVQELMQSEAYLNESHPDHKRTFATVQQWYAKNN